MAHDARRDHPWIRLVALASIGLLIAALPARGAFDIQLTPDSGLSANGAALAAFNRAAAQWEARLSDNVTIYIDADFTSAGFASASTVGQSQPNYLSGGYDVVRNQMVVDASDESTNAIVASLPSASAFHATLPSGAALSGNIGLTAANAKALGFSVTLATDATVTLNSAANFDFDRSDGIAAGKIDFETVAAREIGHALGFVSSVDDVDAGETSIDVTPLDLFRFHNDVAGTDPANASQFSTYSRDLMPGDDAIFDDVTREYCLSTGVTGGDGRQASNWKDDALTSTTIGIFDPTLPAGTIGPITSADLRALDLIGYDLNPAFVPEPTTPTIAASAAIALLRRRRACSRAK